MQEHTGRMDGRTDTSDASVAVAASPKRTLFLSSPRRRLERTECSLASDGRGREIDARGRSVGRSVGTELAMELLTFTYRGRRPLGARSVYIQLYGL